MTNAMAYRGPEGIDHWHELNAGLGHCALHTTPEALREKQPLVEPQSGLALVMAGRVDNWRELRTCLSPHYRHIQDAPDVELVLAAFKHWGERFIEHLDGDFAIALWSREAQRLFCFRDRVGAKPFHYHWDGRIFSFASDVHALLKLPWIASTPNLGKIAEVLANEWLSTDETFWQNVQGLPPAHSLTVAATGISIARYWTLDFETRLRLKDDEEYGEYYKEIFDDAVRRTSRSTHPVAYAVSGGLDSSALFGTAKQLISSGEFLAPEARGYVTAILDDTNAYEADYWRDVGLFYDTKITEVPPTKVSDQWFREWTTRFRDMPDYPNGIINLNLDQQMVRDGCRVQIGGIGGDEWLTGSRYYYYEALRELDLRQLWASLRCDATDYSAQRAARLGVRYGLLPLLPTTVQETIRKARGPSRSPDAPWLSPQMRQLVNERQRV